MMQLHIVEIVENIDITELALKSLSKKKKKKKDKEKRKLGFIESQL